MDQPKSACDVKHFNLNQCYIQDHISCNVEKEINSTNNDKNSIVGIAQNALNHTTSSTMQAENFVFEL